ncbi:MAG: carboxylating nicotinate-nucleotide diphosphorylase [Alistipes sp.]|jgi:nicotinate-nucleotide pyrophosphorylase (carboxylating)|nr:carboxylating nicotinate-nucleotide diphosphorylase [Alistipes sp.]
MKKEYIPFVEGLIDLAIREDIGDGDHTSLASIPADAQGRMKLLVKERGIIAGVEVAEMVFRRLDPLVRLEVFIPDGTPVEVGDIVFYVSGTVRTLLQSERVILNIMQRMTGVATETARYVERVAGTGCRILDTRKTTPGNRVLDKMAVTIGGGQNHRMGLFDMILLKDNHVDFAGGIVEAITGVRRYMASKGLSLPIEVEVRSLEDIDLVFSEMASSGGRVDRIMFDNFDPEMTRLGVERVAALSRRNGLQERVETESSGGIRYENLREYADCGVDFISIGALTHQIKSVDLSLKAI